jgi:hypothetical protein
VFVIALHGNTGDGEYWVHTGGHDPVLDDNDDLDLAGEAGENSVSDPNGIFPVGNHVAKVLTLLPEPPLVRLTA